MISRIRSLALPAQFGVAVFTVVITALMCWIAQGIIGYRLTALVLLLAVSLLAMVLRMGPVMTGATLSALIWNFFFIPPLFTFHIGGTEDALMFLLYFMVATVNAVLSIRIREAERRARDKEEKEKAIALYNTGFGLVIAIPSLIFWRHFRALVDGFAVEMEQQAVRLVEYMHGDRK